MLITGMSAHMPYSRSRKMGSSEVFQGGRWSDITERRFNTESEAFNFTYEYALTPENRFKY